MKLREGAVLLIIGAATVGPVEPSVILPTDINPRQVAIDRNVAYKKGVKCIHVDYSKLNAADPGTAVRMPVDCSLETTAETCARAMREVGVGDTDMWTTQVVMGGFIGKIRVLCIPAPTGLVR